MDGWRTVDSPQGEVWEQSQMWIEIWVCLKQNPQQEGEEEEEEGCNIHHKSFREAAWCATYIHVGRRREVD
jgi:hypothetical protein